MNNVYKKLHFYIKFSLVLISNIKIWNFFIFGTGLLLGRRVNLFNGRTPVKTKLDGLRPINNIDHPVQIIMLTPLLSKKMIKGSFLWFYKKIRRYKICDKYT